MTVLAPNALIISSRMDHIIKNAKISACSGISHSIIPTYIPINAEQSCSNNCKLLKLFLNDRTRSKFTRRYREYVENRPLETIKEECKDHLKNDLAIISVDASSSFVTKSKKEKRVHFFEQLANIAHWSRLG